jgi:hypothetical protein
LFLFIQVDPENELLNKALDVFLMEFLIKNHKYENQTDFFLCFSLINLFTLSAGNPHPELPAIQPNGQIVRHYAYTLSYVEEYKQAEWVTGRDKAKNRSYFES